jgi:nucleotide-binding universal stress UspA family protein
MQKILFPTDFSPLANQAFEYALAFASHYHMTITVLHVYNFNEVEARLAPVEVLEDLHSIRKEEAFENFQTYRMKADQANYNDLTIEPLIKSGFAGEMVLEACEQHGSDLIMLGCKGDGGWTDRILGSVALRIMREAPCPVAAIPEKAVFSPLSILFYAAASVVEGDKWKLKLERLARELQAELSHIHIQAKGSTQIAKRIAEIIDQLEADAVVLSPQQHSFLENLMHPSITEQLTEGLKIPIFAIH